MSTNFVGSSQLPFETHTKMLMHDDKTVLIPTKTSKIARQDNFFTKDNKDSEDWSSHKVLFYCHKLLDAAVGQNDKAGKQRSADKTTISTISGLKKAKKQQ